MFILHFIYRVYMLTSHISTYYNLSYNADSVMSSFSDISCVILYWKLPNWPSNCVDRNWEIK